MSQAIFDDAIFDGDQPVIGNMIFDTGLQIFVVGGNVVEAFIHETETQAVIESD